MIFRYSSSVNARKVSVRTFPHGGAGKSESGNRLVVRELGNRHGVVLPRDEIERFQLAAGRAEPLLRRVEPLGTLLDGLHPLLDESNQGNVRRHGMASSLFGSVRLPRRRYVRCLALGQASGKK